MHYRSIQNKLSDAKQNEAPSLRGGNSIGCKTKYQPSPGLRNHIRSGNVQKPYMRSESVSLRKGRVAGVVRTGAKRHDCAIQSMRIAGDGYVAGSRTPPVSPAVLVPTSDADARHTWP